jgi:membrane protein
MRRLAARLQRLFVVRLLLEYGSSQAANYASVIAFNAFMTMFPLILGVLSVLGLVLRSKGFATQLEQSVVTFFPDQNTQATVLKALASVKQNAGLLGVVSIAGLVWTGTNFFAALEFSLDQVYGVKQRELLPQRLMGLVMLLAFVAAMLLSVGATALIGVLNFVPFIGLLVGAVVMSGLLLLIYWVVPNRPQQWRDVWPGALLCGVLIEVLTLAWPVYRTLVHGFSTYGQTFGLFFLLATWLYLLSQLVLLGAVFNRMRLGPPREEGMVAEPGDGGEPTPAPAEAIEAQRDDAEQRPAAASGSAERRGESRDGEQASHDRDKAAAGVSRSSATGPSGTATAEKPEGAVKRAAFGALGTAIGLFALSRRNQHDARNSGRG